jgi:putative ABC transport system permease protein
MLIDSMRMAWRSLTANTARALLTMLGIIIGVAAVIALVSVGQAATRSVTAQVENIGSNMIVVIPNAAEGVSLGVQDGSWLLSSVGEISAEAPLLQGGVMSRYGTQTWATNLTGTTPPSEAIQGRSMARGRYLVQTDIVLRRQVAVLGATTAQRLFGDLNPVGRTIQVDGMPLIVVGELNQSGGAGFSANPDDVIITPVTIAAEILHTNRVTGFITEARSSALAPLAVGHLQAVMDRRFRSSTAAEVVSEDQLLKTLAALTGTLTIMLGGIAGISLLVGGIGIMNIMLVTVSERTREIGLRKAIGAKRAVVALQFLIESGILSLGGGVVGALLGYAGALTFTTALHWPSGTSPGTILLALVFSVAVGVIFGMWPALRASQLDPIEALRQG